MLNKYFLNECVCVCLCVDHTHAHREQDPPTTPQKAGGAPNSLLGPRHSLDAAEACTQRLPPAHRRLGPWVRRLVG